MFKMSDSLKTEMSGKKLREYKQYIEDSQKAIRRDQFRNNEEGLIKKQIELLESQEIKLMAIKEFLNRYYRKIDKRFNVTIDQARAFRINKDADFYYDDYNEIVCNIFIKTLDPQFDALFRQIQNIIYEPSKRKSLIKLNEMINDYSFFDSYHIEVDDEHLLENLFELNLIPEELKSVFSKIFETKHLFKSYYFEELKNLLKQYLIYSVLKNFKDFSNKFLLSNNNIVIFRSQDFDLVKLFDHFEKYHIYLTSNSKYSKDRKTKYINYNDFYLGINLDDQRHISFIKVGHDATNELVNGVRVIFRNNKGVQVDELVTLLNNYIFSTSKDWNNVIDYKTSVKLDNYIMFKVKRFLKKLHPKKTKKFRTVNYAQYFVHDEKYKGKKRLRRFKEINTEKSLLSDFKNYA